MSFTLAISATGRPQFDKIATRYEYWEVLSPPSVYLNREFPYIFVYCFSCRYLVELGLRQLGPPVPKNFQSRAKSRNVLIFGLTCGLTCYRGAEPPNPQKCSRGCLGECRPEVGCSGGCSGRCLGGCSGPLFSARKRRTSTLPSTFPSTLPSTPLGPALPQAPAGALLGVRGFGTSVAGQATRNFGPSGERGLRLRVGVLVLKTLAGRGLRVGPSKGCCLHGVLQNAPKEQRRSETGRIRSKGPCRTK